MLDWLPKHKAGLTLEHNPHKGVYEDVEEYMKRDVDDWVSEEERVLAYEKDELWTLRWYPETPTGFYTIAASSLEALKSWVEDKDDALL